ncbi:hypothetical protein BGZ74_007686 [Mortierella antarctica]|nr:hypothetical protein BGZ74_007686 [Mortierella antarctica]
MALNLQTREHLSELIVAITKTGDLYLDPIQTKKSDANVKAAYELLMIQLQRKHAQIRFSSTQLIAELFQRSHVFRNLLVADYSIFLQLTVGIHQNTLPPPTVFAEKTKQLAISLTNEWNNKYGAVYKQVALGYEFLRCHLKIDFTNLVPVTDEARSAEQQAQEERSKRIRRKKYEAAATEIDEQAPDIQENVRKMGACFDILVPKLDDEDTLNAIFSAEASNSPDDQDMEGDDEDMYATNANLHRHDPLGVHDNALGSSRYRLEINVSKDNPVNIAESEDNVEVFATLRESYRLIIKKHWPLVMGWLDVLMKVDQEPGGKGRAVYERLLRLVIDLKRDVADAKSKSEDLGVNMDTMYGPHGEESEESENEFEEVEISNTAQSKAKGKQVDRKPLQPSPRARKPANPVFAMLGEEVLKDDPTYTGGTRVKPSSRNVAKRNSGDSLEQKESSVERDVATPGEESRQELLARAPVVPWDDDLAVWDKKEIQFNTSGLEYSHRFLGVGDGSNLVSDATLERMKMRTRIYSPEVPQMIKACRFPMSNGRLCMRRDLVRCPYHGPVVPRDELGQIQRPPGEGGFVREADRELDDEEEAALMERAVRAAGSGSGSGSGSSSRIFKDSSTWEDLEDDVHQALGLEKIEPKRKRGQGSSSQGKKKTKPPSALVNITKPPDSSRVRLLRHVTKRGTREAVAQDRELEKSAQMRDSRLNRWGS